MHTKNNYDGDGLLTYIIMYIELHIAIIVI